MKKSNSEILNKVKNMLSDNNSKINIAKSEDAGNDKSDIDKEIQKWIELNAEKITKKIVQEEVKKILKQ